MSAIRTNQLTKRYGTITAVRDLTLDIEAGEVFGFLGPNGAGKSTTINMMLDFVRPSAGRISILGHDPQSEPREVREQVGVLPEASGYRGTASALEHIEFAIQMQRSDENPEGLLERVGITTAAARPVKEFSKGMRQRLGLVIALVGEPDLLILDEPLSGLDPAGARLFRDIVRAERDRGAAVFVSSHIMDQIEIVCDRVGIMHEGELLAVDTLAGLRDRIEIRDPVIVTVDALPDRSWPAGDDAVVDLTRHGDAVRITCRDAAAAGSVISRLEAGGATIRAIDAESTPLEQVFMAVTGARRDKSIQETTPIVEQ